MRKLFLSLGIVLLMAGQAIAATPGYRQDPGAGDILGQKKLQSDTHKIIRMVRYVPPTYAGASTLAANSIVTWSLSDDDGVTVTTSTTSGDSAVAGIIIAQALTPDTDGNTAAQDRGKGNWTWLQTYGLTTVNLASGSSDAVAGAAFGAGTTAGEMNTFTSQSSDLTTRQGNAGFIYDAATAGDNSVQVFLRLD